MVHQLTAPAPIDESPKGLLTYEEFRASFPDDVRAEWVDGEVILLMPPDEQHQDLIVFLTTILNFFVHSFGLGKVITAPFEMKLRDGNSYREPDLLFVASDHLDRLDGRRLVGPADLAIEIISDDSVARDRRDKFADYAAGGVQEYWVLDPRSGKKDVSCWTLSAEGYYLPINPDQTGCITSCVLSGFTLNTRWITDDSLPSPLDALTEIDPEHFQPVLVEPRS